METYGWDTVYSININRVNSVLAENMNTLPQLIDYSTEIEGMHSHIQCNLAPWEIVKGGSGKLLHLKISIVNGMLQINSNSKEISNVDVIIQVSLQFLPSNIDPSKHELMFNISELGVIGSKKEGAVSPVTVIDRAGCLSETAKNIVLWLVAKYLVERASIISYVFAQINYVKPGTDTWLSPKQCTYAYVESQEGNGYLSILSVTTDRDMSGLPLLVDPSMMSENANAAYLISKNMILQNIIMPMLPSMYPGSRPDGFYMNSNHCIVNSGSLGTLPVTAGLITYYPRITHLYMTIEGGDLKTSVDGFCDLYANITMNFSIKIKNNSEFNPATSSIAFYEDPDPRNDYSQDIPWYLLWLNLIVGIIVRIVVKIIADSIAQTLQSGSQSFATSPPPFIDWTGVNNAMQVTDAGLDNCYYLKGNI